MFPEGTAAASAAGVGLACLGPAPPAPPGHQGEAAAETLLLALLRAR